MKNNDYLVYLITKRGVVTKFARDKTGWVQTAPSGIRRRCSAEQVLNHLLPALVLGDNVIRTKVKLRRGRHFNPRLERMKAGAKVPSSLGVDGQTASERGETESGKNKWLALFQAASKHDRSQG